MVEFRQLIVAAILIGIFIFAMVSFGVNLASDYNTNVSILDNEAFNESFGELESELISGQDTAEAQRDVQEQTTPTTSGGDLLLESTPKTASTFTGMWRNIYNLTLGLIMKTLGISPAVMAGITAILLITITLLIWGLVKSGR